MQNILLQNCTVFKNSILSDLELRGFFYQCTDHEGLINAINSGTVTFYVGFDPTGKSLHVGHLLWIRLVNQLQKLGLKPIILAGGATGKIGDPSGKDKMRSMLTYEELEENISLIVAKLSNLINFKDTESHNKAVLVNNDDWTKDVKYIEFLRDFGSVVSVNKMLTMDSVRSRLERESHLSFLEFNYMLLQAFDFYVLHRDYGCTLQIGGSDQWPNIIQGVDLIRRKSNAQSFGISIPLLLTSSGQKMGKTEKGAVWLDEKMTTPFDFWQYWRNVDDKDVVKLLKLFCDDLTVNEIDSYENSIGTKDINEAKIILADSVTKFVHGDSVLTEIKSKSDNMFYGDKRDASTFNVAAGTLLCDFLVTCGSCQSKSSAKKLIEGGGVKLDGVAVSDVWHKLEVGCIVSVGKKHFYKIDVT